MTPFPAMNRWSVALGLAFAAALFAAAIGRLGLAQTLELKTYDARMRAVATGQGAASQVAMVLIDDHSIRQLEPLVGRWPWPRMVHAVLVNFLARGPAKLVVYDVLFSESDKGTTDIGGTVWTGAESDQALVDAVQAAGNVILVAEASSEATVEANAAAHPSLEAVPALAVRWPLQGFAEKRPLLVPPFPALAQAARGIGHARVAYDLDGPWRRYIPFVEVAGRIVPSLPMAAALTAMGLAPEQVSGSRASLRLGATRVPWIEQVVPDYYGPDQTVWRPLVPFRGPTMRADNTPTFASYSFQDIFLAEQQLLAGETPHIDPAVFKDQIVVVGVTAQGLMDLFMTPFGEGRMPGAEVHANVIDGLLSGRAVAPAAPWQRIAVTLTPALAIAAVGALAAPWVTAAAAAAVAAGVVWYATRALGQGVWLPLVVPVTACLLTFLGDLAWMYFVEGREKRRVKRLFSRYVSKDVYQQLLANPADAVLGGERREMTVLFSDMRGFTTLSESGEAEDLVRQLNQYFTRMVGVVFANRGTIDKFVGDMVMALYGAPLDDPDHADHAVQTALDMVRELRQLNRVWAVEGRTALDIGIGISTGEMIAGNIGSDTIMSYTVIGDNVNLGARLESLNKDFGTRILISEATRRQLKGSYDIRPLGDVMVKGKSKAVPVFEVRADGQHEQHGQDEVSA
ncbi:MAG TPA: adenylate/guanylate cyclase domain-containing protein [Vicinamibacterales bacterium]|nr:adenylate/guanylate cyclase domain-containing protein [Vicinamibacterales bacterium]